MNNSRNNTRAQGQKKAPASPLVPAIPAFMVLLVLGVFATLVLTGMDMQTAAVIVGVGGMLGIELVRRLMQTLSNRR